MFEWPTGIVNLILLLGWLGLTIMEKFRGVSHGHRHWQVATVTFSTALVANLALVLLPAEEIHSELFAPNAINGLFSIAVLAFALFSHINFKFERVKMEGELAPLEILMTLLALQAIHASNLLVYVIVLPTLFLILCCAPMLDRSSGQKIAPSSLGILGSAIMLVGLSIATALLYSTLHTIEIRALSSLLILTQERPAFLLSWSIVFLALFSFLLLAPFQFFIKQYQKVGSWAVAGFFRSQLILVGAILLFRWIRLLEMNSILSNIFEGGWPGQNPRIGLTLTIVFGMWLFAQSFIVRKNINLMTIWVFQPLILFFFGLGIGTPSAITWGTLSLFVFVCASPLLCKLLIDLKTRMDVPLNRMSEGLKTAPKEVRTQVFALFLLLTPLSSLMGFELLMEFTKSWTADIFDQTQPPRVFIVVLVLMTFGLLVGSGIRFLAQLFFENSGRGGATDSMSTLDRMWNYTLLFPLIIVGIYPAPLYNYISKYLVGYLL